MNQPKELHLNFIKKELKYMKTAIFNELKTGPFLTEFLRYEIASLLYLVMFAITSHSLNSEVNQTVTHADNVEY